MNTFLCGAAREDITPPLGTCLYGYRPNLASQRLHDRLAAAAIAFSDGKETVLLLSTDLGDIGTALDTELREHIAAAGGVTPSAVILCATHTHSAPNVSGVAGWGDIDRPYVDAILLPAVCRAARRAVEALRPAQLGYATGRSEVGINRRQQLRGGWIDFGQNPWGCFDPAMTVLTARDADTHKPLCHIVHYGCHGTACGQEPTITRDWSGVMVDRLEQHTGAPAVFFNGAIGDVGPRISNGLTVGDISYVEELGNLAALDAVRIQGQIHAYHTPALRVFRDTVHLPYEKLPTLPAVRELLAAIGNPDGLINWEKLRYEYLRAVEAMLLAGTEPPAAFTYDTTLVALGETVFLPFPFEIFSEISLRLRAYTGYQNTLCLSCANGYNGYLPTRDQLERGGYEVDVFRYANACRLADDTDEHIISENLRILGV